MQSHKSHVFINGFRKCPYKPHKESLEIQWGRGGGGAKKENKLLKRTFKLTETSRGVGVGVGGFDQRNSSWGL